jgi:hypothetical protein
MYTGASPCYHICQNHCESQKGNLFVLQVGRRRRMNATIHTTVTAGVSAGPRSTSDVQQVTSPG